ncbi:hypothetical protein HYV74_03500 [Candidatus Uhrbacteria bacterium]|nr:hypothetical protein [Candidatus Uhrbacteria bacterium]
MTDARPLDLLVTLWPSFPHFAQFADDPRLAGIRLNSAMVSNAEIEQELGIAAAHRGSVPLFFDVKGRQLRIVEVDAQPDHLECVLNHPIAVQTPTSVLFKGGEDSARLDRLADGGRRLIFHRGPRFAVRPGESLHIRHPSLRVSGNLFTEQELQKIATVRGAGFTRYFLSYVESARDVDEFRELVGRDAEVWLKIENPKGLQYVATEFRKEPNLVLVAACGDLYVEMERPHAILGALRMIVEHDPEACVGSRMLLSVVQEPLPPMLRSALQYIAERRPETSDLHRMLMAVLHRPVPSLADFAQLAWLYDIGYRRMMLCDELCLKGELLTTAVHAFDAFRTSYGAPITKASPLISKGHSAAGSTSAPAATTTPPRPTVSAPIKGPRILWTPLRSPPRGGPK